MIRARRCLCRAPVLGLAGSGSLVCGRQRAGPAHGAVCVCARRRPPQRPGPPPHTHPVVRVFPCAAARHLCPGPPCRCLIPASSSSISHRHSVPLCLVSTSLSQWRQRGSLCVHLSPCARSPAIAPSRPPCSTPHLRRKRALYLLYLSAYTRCAFICYISLLAAGAACQHCPTRVVPG